MTAKIKTDRQRFQKNKKGGRQNEINFSGIKIIIFLYQCVLNYKYKRIMIILKKV